MKFYFVVFVFNLPKSTKILVNHPHTGCTLIRKELYVHLALFHTFIKLCRHHCDTNQKTCAHLQIIRSNHPLNPTCSLPNHIPWCHIHTSLKCLQAWGLHLLPGQPTPIPEEILPNIQSKAPLVQLEIISSCPVACHLRKEADTQNLLCPPRRPPTPMKIVFWCHPGRLEGC